MDVTFTKPPTNGQKSESLPPPSQPQEDFGPAGLPIAIVSSPRKTCITKEYFPKAMVVLADEEADLPPGFDPGDNAKYTAYSPNAPLGSYNCYKAHQKALRAILDANPTSDTFLILEDDAVPLKGIPVPFVIAKAAEILRFGIPQPGLLAAHYGLMTLHYRLPEFSSLGQQPISDWVWKDKMRQIFGNPVCQFNINAYEFRTFAKMSPFAEVRLFGSLAYLVKRYAAEEIIKIVYDGTPMDLYINNRVDTLFFEASPLFHDRSMGSLLG